MSWDPISTFVRTMLPKVRQYERDFVGNVRQDAALLAMAAHGLEDVTARPTLVNLAALALNISLAPRPVLHEVRPALVRTIDQTDLRSSPTEEPSLLRAAWMIESRDPRNAIVGTCSALAGYRVDEKTIYLVGLGYPDGAWVAKWTPHWSGGSLSSELPDPEPSAALIDDVDAHHEWARAAARFALVLGLMLDAQGSPLRTRDEEERPKKKATKANGEPPPWVTRHLSISAADSAASAEHRTGGGAAVLVDDRAAVDVGVRGHLKRQPYGPGGELRRWIYVEGYEARRWVAPRPLKLVLS